MRIAGQGCRHMIFRLTCALRCRDNCDHCDPRIPGTRATGGDMLETVEIETGSEPAGAVIWLHGLGADGHDFEPVVPELRLPDDLPLRFVFPHAPIRPVTINAGMRMRAWYDIVAIDRRARQDEEGIRESAAATVELIEREKERGIPAARIVLAGFSQGGAVAIHTALR